MDLQSILSSVLDEVYEKNEYPALAALEAEWSETRPFEGLRVLVATPIYRNTMTQYRALLAGGASLLVGFSGMNDPDVVDFLKDWGIPVVTPAEMLEAESRGEFVDLVLDCAGPFAVLHPKIGFVELTRSGVQYYKDAEKPVFVADSGIVKRIETSLGTGDGYFRALEKLGFAGENVSGAGFEGKKLVVFGSGKVGSGIALQGVRRGCAVSVVTDLNRGQSSAAPLEKTASSATPETMPAGDFSAVLEQNGVNVVDCHDYATVSALIEKADFVVTATGIKDALAAPELQKSLLSTSAVLANMGVEDEYGEAVPVEKVLNAKGPLNFILEEPTHLKYIDTSLALHAALAERLVQEAAGSTQSGSDCAAIDEGLRFPPQEIEQRLLTIAIQNGVIGPEICSMLGGIPTEMD
ncbi:adenosylhomocysteinase [Fibrobacter sp. UWB12]|uniref:adenosylhomocysteinase n=1 Tax=Fibrobacter sp. UWB12 TaxID=1896203 RepID=UPI000912DF3B|nr:adenosylhomocysteinase [Fibrobacter sp. UWB12]SHK88058.1 adenosylhomocysteinase [Fibrobacter sp. UWB12]